MFARVALHKAFDERANAKIVCTPDWLCVDSYASDGFGTVAPRSPEKSVESELLTTPRVFWCDLGKSKTFDLRCDLKSPQIDFWHFDKCKKCGT